MSTTSITTARLALHAVAEQVVSAALFKATGRIGLRPTPGGFGTPVFDGSQVRVEGVDLVVVDGADERRAPLSTVGEAAAFVGIEPTLPTIYPPATRLDPDAPLDIDPVAAADVHAWFDTSGKALDLLCQRFGGSEPPVAQIWPEHFDLAVAISEVNYGGSPGDADHPTPYAYVGPWDRSALEDDFWNEPFGASRPAPALPSVDLLVTFFEQGYTLCSR